jgi:hypothetical protein
MGKLLYGTEENSIGFSDRFLAHLQIVVGAKLRRGESFYFSWRDDRTVGEGRSSVWIAPSIPLCFTYASSSAIEINREWIDVLAVSANSARGLEFLAEPGTAIRTPSDGAAHRAAVR